MVNLVDIGCASINIDTSKTNAEDIMKEKHTLGSLEAINNLVRSSMTPPDGTPKGILIAECNDSYGLPHSPEAMAYAKLFAAAPELLAALKDMVAMMDSGDEHGAGSEWHRQASAAIAKAEGGAA